jgi:hypothetical protein
MAGDTNFWLPLCSAETNHEVGSQMTPDAGAGALQLPPFAPALPEAFAGVLY